jgi:hypothetical protein
VVRLKFATSNVAVAHVISRPRQSVPIGWLAAKTSKTSKMLGQRYATELGARRRRDREIAKRRDAR